MHLSQASIQARGCGRLIIGEASKATQSAWFASNVNATRPLLCRSLSPCPLRPRRTAAARVALDSALGDASSAVASHVSQSRLSCSFLPLRLLQLSPATALQVRSHPLAPGARPGGRGRLVGPYSLISLQHGLTKLNRDTRTHT